MFVYCNKYNKVSTYQLLDQFVDVISPKIVGLGLKEVVESILEVLIVFEITSHTWINNKRKR